MDIVVRTPHGDADVSVVGRGPTTTLGDIIGAITGQAVPRLALVDGRVVDCGERLDDVGLLIGSIVTTEPLLPEPTPPDEIELVQVAGHGAGRSVHLQAGRYRIGPGRRAIADELAWSPVERAEFELVIEPVDGSLGATIVPNRSEAMLDGVELDSPTPWPIDPGRGMLTIGPRAFLLGVPSAADPPEATTMRALDGTVTFHRPPRQRPAPPRLPLVDAVSDAAERAPTLWERRADHPDAFSLPFGIRSDASGTSIVALGLADDRAVAITGSERFRSALARTLLIEAVTLHGPSDLDVVVLTSPGAVATWDWAKWLPHLRHDGRPAIWSTEHDIARWVRDTTGREPEVAKRSHRTLAIVDDSALWTRRDSPVRAVLSGPPDDLLLLALCSDVGAAPTSCTSALAETPDGLVRTQSFARNDDDGDDIRAALAETSVAEGVARSLAPLVDVDLPPSDTRIPVSSVDLHELIGASDVHEVIERWAAPEPSSTLVIGRREQSPVGIDAGVDVTAVIGSTLSDASDVGASWIVAQCADRSPDAFWVVPLGPSDTALTELLWRLPHASQRHDAATPIVADRLVARLRSLLADAAGPERIVLVTTDSRIAPALLDDGLLHALIDAAHAIEGLAVLVISDRGDLDITGADTVIRVEHQYRLGGGSRSATISVGDDAPGAPFSPIGPSGVAEDELDLRPAVVGRLFTPLERRIEQQRDRAMSALNPSLAETVTLLGSAAHERGQHPERPNRVVVPPPLPTRIDLDELFETWPGDGVPLGLADDATTAGLRPVWWQPGSGATLLFGSRRSGVEQVLSTIILGITDRFASDDVRLVVVEPSSTRRRTLSELEHPVLVVAADRGDELAAALDEIETIGAAPASDDTSTRVDGPRPVVAIADLAQLRRQLADTDVLTRLDAVLRLACAADPVLDVVAYASELAAAGSFADEAQHRLVGACSDPNELAALGIDNPAELEGVLGRCRSLPDGSLVQMAMPAPAPESQLARRSVGDTP